MHRVQEALRFAFTFDSELVVSERVRALYEAQGWHGLAFTPLVGNYSPRPVQRRGRPSTSWRHSSSVAARRALPTSWRKRPAHEGHW